jgi:hypothetical protein
LADSTDVSILEVIKRGGYEASLITTFNATLPFYEEVVLRRLIGAGVRYNVVLMDAAQCAQSWASEAERPRLAGLSYTLVPMRATGAFHPKVCLLLGTRKAAILVGSHNLTLSGFGFNREVTNWVQVEGPKDAEGVAALADAWTLVDTWLEQQREWLPDAVLESAVLALSNFVRPLTQGRKEDGASGIIGQTANGPSLWDQFLPRVPSNITRIAVVGAFFDARFEMLRRLEAQWPTAEIVVAVDPQTVQLGHQVTDLRSRFVRAASVWPDTESSYLHAKAIYFEGTEQAVLVSGSANPSWPAWFNLGRSGNVEAIMIRSGVEALSAAAAMGLSECFRGDPIDAETLSQAVERTHSELSKSGPAVESICMGVADPADDVIWLQPPTGRRFVSAVTFGSDASRAHPADLHQHVDGRVHLKVDGTLSTVRSALLASRDGGPDVRVLVHHAAALAGLGHTKKQAAIREALGCLGSDDGDVARLIAAVERVIFSDDVERDIQTSGGTRGTDSDGTEPPQRPESLAVHVADMSKQRKKLRLLRAGDLAYLIDVLIRRLGMDLQDQSKSSERIDRTEEEQVGKDDEAPPELPSLGPGIDTAQIAKVVATRARTLIRRMVAQLKLASTDESRAPSAIVQLVAVLGVVRELRRLRNAARWRGVPSLVEERDRRQLLNEAMAALFGHRSMLLPKLVAQTGAEVDEVGHLRSLLLWLAWDLGEELTDHIGALQEREVRERQISANAVLLELLPQVASREDETVELERSLLMTAMPTGEEGARLNRWLDRHLGVGRQLSTATSSALGIRLGALAPVPKSNPLRLRVVCGLNTYEISFWEFDDARTFDRRLVKMG